VINFNEGEEQLNKYFGSEKKTTVLYNDTIYMLKFPDPIRGSKLKGVLSYKNNQYSEHIGSSIFTACGLVAQETALGNFTDATGKEKIVVGCKDFTQDGWALYEMAKLANQTAVSGDKLSASIENIDLILGSSKIIQDKEAIINQFWDMFVVDALIGNGDRHFGNWGILENGGIVKFAPVYDCGSSLGALLDDDEMETLMTESGLFKNREFNVTSCYYLDGKRIFYQEIFRNPTSELAEAIKRTVPKIDMGVIAHLVDSVQPMSEIRKNYLNKALSLRYEQILTPALKRILKNERNDLKTKPSLMDRVENGKQKAAQQERAANRQDRTNENIV
jgi:hypothetical protein